MIFLIIETMVRMFLRMAPDMRENLMAMVNLMAMEYCIIPIMRYAILVVGRTILFMASEC